MVVADFTGGEAEELRRAFGFKRSEARMKDIELNYAAAWNKRNHRRGPGQDRTVDHIIRAVRISGITRGELRAASRMQALISSVITSQHSWWRC